MLAESFLELLKDPNHWLFELMLEALTGFAIWPLGRWLFNRAIRRHDKDVHGPV